MNTFPAWRRLANKLARHAGLTLQGAPWPWAEAMQRELDYIEDDRAALRWAFGCVLASYRTRLSARSGPRTRDLLRQAVASGAVMLVIGVAFLENAGGQTEPPRSVPDESACDTRNTTADIDQTPPSAAWNPGRPAPRPQASCADPHPSGTGAPETFEPSKGESR